MKRFTVTLLLPDWAKYVTTDNDGQVNCWEIKPKHYHGGFWLTLQNRMRFNIGRTFPPQDYTQTLVELT